MGTTGKTIIVVIIAALILGWFFYPSLFGSEESKIAQTATSQRSVFTVNAEVVRKEVLNNDLRVTGSLIANESVVIKSEVSARVESINFKEGQQIKKGQLLIQLNNEEILAEIEKLNFTKKLNQDNEYRQKQLLEKEAISKEEYETALTTLNTTLADLKVRRVQLEKHRITAPFDGVIGLRQVSTGSYISPSDELVTIYSINPIKIDLSVPGKYAAEVNPDDDIEFRVDAYEDEVFKGKIYAVEPQIDPETRSIKIRAVSDNSDGKLLPGQFAKINLTISKFDEAILIPTEAVIPELNGKKVFIRNNGVVENRPIETGIRTSDKIQVTAGLSDGDTVITTGILQIRPGMKVGITLDKQ